MTPPETPDYVYVAMINGHAYMSLEPVLSNDTKYIRADLVTRTLSAPSTAADLVAVPREVIEKLFTWLSDDKWRTWMYMEGTEVYEDRRKAVAMLQPYTKGE